jgi:hypothetical protein
MKEGRRMVNNEQLRTLPFSAPWNPLNYFGSGTVTKTPDKIPRFIPTANLTSAR